MSDERSTGSRRERLFESDLPLILATIGALYLLYVIIGVTLGYQVRGMVSTLTRITFLIAVYSMIVLAVNLHWGYTGLFNIGIAGFMGVGIYTTVILSAGEPTGVTDIGGFGLPLSVGIVGGVLAAALLGLVVGLPALRLRADYFAIVTLAAAEIVRLTINSSTLARFELFGREVGTAGASGIRYPGLDPVTALIGRLAQPYYGTETAQAAYAALMRSAQGYVGANPAVLVEAMVYGTILLFVVSGYYWLLKRTGESPFGRVLKAIRDDEEVASALGKNTSLFKLKGFVLGCALMGLAGILWRLRDGYVDPNRFRPEITFYAWIALIIGGTGSTTGSVIGAALFVALLFEGPRYLANVIDAVVPLPDAPTTFGRAAAELASFDALPLVAYTFDNIGSLQLVIMGIVLIVIMQRRPEGMLGHRVEEAAAIDLIRDAGPERGEDR